MRGLSDQLVAISRTLRRPERLAARGRMEDRRVDGIRDHDRIPKLEPELAVLLEAVPRLEDRRVRELVVDLDDPRVGPVVEAAVDADRAVDAMHHPRVRPGEPPQPSEVEVERVEEAGRGLARDPVQLDREPAAPELPDERTQELVAAAGGRRRELVEEREISPTPPGSEPVGLH